MVLFIFLVVVVELIVIVFPLNFYLFFLVYFLSGLFPPTPPTTNTMVSPLVLIYIPPILLF